MDRASRRAPEPLRTSPRPGGCRGASVNRGPTRRASSLLGAAPASPLSRSGSRGGSQAIRTTARPNGRAVGSVDGCGQARAARWYRAESPTARLPPRKAEPLRRPLPRPVAPLDGGVHPFDERRAASRGSFLLGADGEAHAPAFDHDWLAGLCCVQHVRKVLTRLRCRVPFHQRTLYTRDRTQQDQLIDAQHTMGLFRRP